MLATRPSGSRLEGDLPKALLEHLRHLMRTAGPPLLNVLSIMNAAPPSGGHWGKARRRVTLAHDCAG